MLPRAWIPPRGVRLRLKAGQVERTAVGPLLPYLQQHLRVQRRGLVLLGSFGSGKTTLANALAGPGVKVVPLRLLVRGGSLEARWRELVGALGPRERVVLDGLDEVDRPDGGTWTQVFDAVTHWAGEGWIVTSRPGFFRTDTAAPSAHQVDVLLRPDVEVVEIAPLLPREVERALGGVPFPELCTSPVLVRLALECGVGGVTSPAELVERYLRWLGADCEVLEQAAWLSFRDREVSVESASFAPEHVPQLLGGQPVERLLVPDADGRLRFGHRSLYDFLVARRVAPLVAANQGGGPNAVSGLATSEAMRVFLKDLVRQAPAVVQDGWVYVPTGNWVSGGDHGGDERPLRIRHLDRPCWLAQRPVSEAEVVAWLGAEGRSSDDFWFLHHWRRCDGRLQPVPGTEGRPARHLRPGDADALAAWAGARVPTWQEWEKGVRGITGRRYPWGDHPDASLANTAEAGLDAPRDLDGAPIQGPTGVIAACGDVFEITASHYRDRPAWGRVVMGGSYAHPCDASRAGLRLSHTLSGHLACGVRLARDG